MAQDLIENTPVNYEDLSPIGSNISSPKEIDKKENTEKNLHNEYEAYERRIKKITSESEFKLSELNSRTDGVEEKLDLEIQKIELAYEDAVTRITEKKSQIDNILGHVSGRAIAGDYEESAADEKHMADFLRYASIGCMVLIIIIVSYSFWESTTDNFDWQNSIFRIVLSFFLSIPAAYLARESAKHRERQNNHLQTALDLKAITPYIASLPEDEQHKLKAQIANRIFASDRSAIEQPDSYPINTQEIIMELIKKINTPSKK